MFSQYTPPSMEEAIRLGVQGINPTGPNLALATHGIASQLITQLADGSKKLNMTNTLRMAWVAGSAVVGSILLQDAKNKTDSALDAKDRQSANAAAPSGTPPKDPNEDPNDSGYSKKDNLSQKEKELLKDVKLDGKNPGHVRVDDKSQLRVDTEKLGGKEAWKKMAENLLQETIPDADINITRVISGGRTINIRSEGASGHPKIQITNQQGGKVVIEKITFL